MMPPRLRTFTLTAHVISSVGWVGAAATYACLALTVLASHDPTTVRITVLGMESVDLYVIVPLALASFVTGVIQSLGSRWGLFRHYWVVFKLLITIFASVLLTEYTRSLIDLNPLAHRMALSVPDLDKLRDPGALVHSGGGVLVLLVMTVLATYKPRGLTPHGQRTQSRH